MFATKRCAVLCLGSIGLGLSAEGVQFLQPSLSACLDGRPAICREPVRESTVPPHVHTTSSTDVGTPWVLRAL